MCSHIYGRERERDKQRARHTDMYRPLGVCVWVPKRTETVEDLMQKFRHARACVHRGSAIMIWK